MTFYIESLGCAKNQVDSEEAIAFLEAAGLAWVPEPDAAELIIVNTCGFIESAKEESIQTSLALKRRYPDKRVLLTGCLVQRYGQQLAGAMGEIDGFAGLRDFPGLLALAQDHRRAPAERSAGSRRLSAPPLPPAAAPASQLPRSRFLSYPGSAYLKVAEGCANRCSYCAIPLIRGELVSRPQEEILREVEQLLQQGLFEINLVAQDLASFGLDRGRAELLPLLERILSLEGTFWLRLLYLHPDRFPAGLLELAASDGRLLPYFDLPFQHASEAVLGRMGRRGSGSRYLELVERIRAALPQAVIRSTFLVGFPGETEAEFRQLLEFQRLCRLDWVGVFCYSPEEGTAAFAHPGRVRVSVARRRKRLLEEAQLPITEQRLQAQVGRTLEVLVEEEVRGEGLFLARSYLQAPDVDGLIVLRTPASGRLRPHPGEHRRARVEGRAGVDLEATLEHP
jgi:ribosomal protein S12 methylthiotransferase